MKIKLFSFLFPDDSTKNKKPPPWGRLEGAVGLEVWPWAALYSKSSTFSTSSFSSS